MIQFLLMFTQKWKFCHNLLIVCQSIPVEQRDVWKNIGNQTTLEPIDFIDISQNIYFS